MSFSDGTEHKYEIVKRLQEKKHICGMTGDGVNDAPALKKADIGIAVADATDAARGASDIVLTEPGLSVIISAVLTSRCIFQRMKNYTVSIAYDCLVISTIRFTTLLFTSNIFFCVFSLDRSMQFLSPFVLWYVPNNSHHNRFAH